MNHNRKSQYFYRIIKKIHDKKLQQRKIQHRLWRKNQNKSMQGFSASVRRYLIDQKKRFSNYCHITAPSHLSLINNPDEVLQFIHQLSIAYNEHKKVYVKLRKVTSITNDALVLLLSNVAQFKAAHIPFNGNRPRDPEIGKIINNSGFFEILYRKSKEDIVQTGYDLSHQDFFTHAQKNVDAELTANLILQNSEFLWGEKRRCQGVQRIFIELMQNTNNHASHTVGDKYWWISVSRRKNPNTICFSFIDYGMGIFGSLANKPSGDKFFGWVEKIKQICSPDKHYEVLKTMLSGEFHNTVTNSYFRGKGIPGIYREFAKGSIHNLIIISNDTYGNVTTDDFRSLNNELTGTFVYFEVDKDCKNLKYNI